MENFSYIKFTITATIKIPLNIHKKYNNSLPYDVEIESNIFPLINMEPNN